MKRISLLLAFLGALVFCFGSAAVADPGPNDTIGGAISISSIDGYVSGDQLNAKAAVIKFYLRLVNDIGIKTDISNGFRIYSPDGASFGAIKLDTLPPYVFSADFGIDVWDFKKYFDQAWGAYYDGIGGAPSDTVGWIGGGSPNTPTKQLQNGANVIPMAISVPLLGLPADNDGKHLCIDTAFWGDVGTWVWTTKDINGDFLPDNRYPTFDGAPGVKTFDSDGWCFNLWDVPNLAPSISNAPAQIGPQKYCSVFTFDFNATDPEGDPYTFEMVSGPAGSSVDPVTGVFTWAGATIADAGASISVEVRANDGQVGASVIVPILVINEAPEITTLCPADGGFMSTGAVKTFQLAGTDDCGSLIWSVVDDGNPATTATIDAAGLLSFSTTEAATAPVCVTVELSDGALADQCEVCFTVSAKSAFGVTIEKTHGTLQGGFEYVDITLDYANFSFGGFNMLIAYDNSALSLQEVLKGTALYTDCEWEYFNYTFGADGNCSGGCPSGLVRVVGIAETNNGAHSPVCITPPAGSVLFTLKFLVSNDRTLECQYAPIRFFWIECGDNTISDETGEILYIANRVYDYHMIDDNIPMDPALAVFPGYAGVPIGACPGTIKGEPIRDIDFYDGGIDIVCADSIDARGDVNLNGISNEIADAVLFSRYFVYGFSVFTIAAPGYPVGAGQIAATDVNADGLVLTVADLVYMVRIITGQAQPYYKVSPVVSSYSHNTNGDLAVEGEMGAAYVVVAGNVTPTLNATGMEMAYNYDGTNTRIIVFPALTEGMTEMASFTGNFLNVRGEIVSIEMATAEGAPVVGKLIPSAFALNQNYPNPFNPATIISFALPTASDYSLTIYNVTGQKVADYSGTAEAGTVEVEWNASNNASGIYFYKLNAGSFSATKKMVLLK